MLFAGFAVADPGQSAAHHHLTLVGIVLAGRARDAGRLVDRLRGRARRAPGAARTPRRASCTWGPAQIERADRWFAALRRAGGPVRAHDPDRPRVRVAAGRRGEDAARPLHAAHADRLAPVGARAGARRERARQRLDERAQGLRVRRLRGRRPRRARDRLRGRAPAARAATGRPGSRCRAAERALCRSATRSRSGWPQGPTELLPVSSSAHTTLLIPCLARLALRRARRASRASPSRSRCTPARGAGAGDRHARRAGRGDARRSTAAAPCVIALSLAPPALAGTRCERSIERRLGGPRSIAAGLLAGAVAMALADAPRPRRARRRVAARTAPADGLALGLAQAAALVPGVSRNGATLTAARARGFARARRPGALVARRAAGDRSARACSRARGLAGDAGAARRCDAALLAGGAARVRLDARRARGCCAARDRARARRCCPTRSTAACSRRSCSDACERAQ